MLPSELAKIFNSGSQKYYTQDIPNNQPSNGFWSDGCWVKYRFLWTRGLNEISYFPSIQFNDALKKVNSDGTRSEPEAIHLFAFDCFRGYRKYTVVGNLAIEKNLSYAGKTPFLFPRHRTGAV